MNSNTPAAQNIANTHELLLPSSIDNQEFA